MGATLFALVLAVVCVLAWATLTRSGRAFVLARTLALVEGGVLDADIDVGELSRVVGRVVLEDVTLATADGRALVAASRVEVAYKLLPLLSARVDLPEVVVLGSRLDVRIGEDGRLNLATLVPVPDPPPPPREGPPWVVELGRVVVRLDEVVVTDHREGETVLARAAEVDATAALSIPADGAIVIGVETLRATVSDPVEAPIGIDDGTLSVSPGELVLALGSLRAAETRIEGPSARLATGTRPPFERVDLTLPPFVVSPETVNRFLPEETSLRVPVTVAVEVHGPVDDVAVDIPLSGAGGELLLSARLDLSDVASPEWHAELRLARFVPTDWVTVPVDADVSGALQVDGVGADPATARVRARADLGPSSVSGFALDGAFVVASYEAGAVELTSLDAWRRAARLQAGGSVDPSGSVTAWMDVSAPDLRDFATDVRLDAARDLEGAVRAQARIDAELGFDPTDPAAYPTVPDEWMDLLARVHGAGTARVRRFRGFGAAVDRLDVAWSATAGGDRPDVEATVSGAGVLVGSAQVDRADVGARFDGRQLGVTADASLSGGSIVAGTDATLRLDDDLVADVARLEARVAGFDLLLVGSTRVELELDAARRPVAVALSPATLLVAGSTVDVEGRYALDSGAISARVEATDVEVAPLGARFAPELGLEGTVSLTARAEGSLDRPSLGVEASAAGLAVLGLAPHDLRAQVALRRDTVSGRVDLERDGRPVASVSTGAAAVPVRLNVERGRVRLDGNRPMSLEATVERLALGSLAPLLPPDLPVELTGDIALDLGVAGTPRAPEVVAAVALTDVAATVALGDGEWVIDRSSGTIRARVDGSGERWAIDGEAQLALFGREIVAARIRTDVDPERLMQEPLLAVQELVLEGQLSVTGVTAADLPPSVRASADLRDGRFDADVRWTGPARGGQGAVTVSATSVRVGTLEPVSVALEASAGSSVDVTAVAVYGPADTERGLTGPEGVAGVDGWSPPEGDVGVAMALRLGAPLMGLLDAARRSDIAVEARVVLPTAHVAQGASIAPSLTDAPGTVGGYVDLAGTLGAPRLFGRIALRDLALANGRRGAAGLEVAYADGFASAHATVCEGADVGIEADVAVGVDLGIEALASGLDDLSGASLTARVLAPDADLSAVVPQALLAGVVEDVDGRVAIDMSASGTLGAPRLSGTMRVADARAGLVALNRTFHNVSAELELTDEGIELASLSVDDDRGRLRGTGRIALRDFAFAGANLEVRAREFLLSSTSGLGAFVTGQVTVSAQEVDGALLARVVLSDVEVALPDDVGGSDVGRRSLPEWVYFEGEDVAVDQRGSRNPEPLQVVAEPAESPLRLVVDVATSNRGVVRHQLAEIWFTVDLEVAVEGSEVSAEGHVDLPDGVIRVAGKDFDVANRRITFPAGADGIDPYVDVEAVHDLGPSVTEYLAGRGWVASGETATVSVVVRGSVSDLAADPENAIRLVSDPRGLSEPDVFQLLATGRMSDDSEASGGQQGLGALTSLALGLAGDRLAGGIPIDTLSIESTSEAQRVEGGKYISDDIYVSGTYIRSPDDADDNNFEVALEWILRRIGPGSLRLELRGGDRAKGGLELLYNLVRGR